MNEIPVRLVYNGEQIMEAVTFSKGDATEIFTFNPHLSLTLSADWDDGTLVLELINRRDFMPPEPNANDQEE